MDIIAPSEFVFAYMLIELHDTMQFYEQCTGTNPWGKKPRNGYCKSILGSKNSKHPLPICWLCLHKPMSQQNPNLRSNHNTKTKPSNQNTSKTLTLNQMKKTTGCLSSHADFCNSHDSGFGLKLRSNLKMIQCFGEVAVLRRRQRGQWWGKEVRDELKAKQAPYDRLFHLYSFWKITFYHVQSTWMFKFFWCIDTPEHRRRTPPQTHDKQMFKLMSKHFLDL